MNYRFNPYLSFDGTCEEAFGLYSRVFGGEPRGMHFGDMPGDNPIPSEYHRRIMHTQLLIGDQMLMGSDTVPGFADAHQVGNNVAFSIATDTIEDAKRILDLLAENGRVLAPFEQHFFGYMVVSEDPYGVQWIVTHGTNMQ